MLVGCGSPASPGTGGGSVVASPASGSSSQPPQRAVPCGTVPVSSGPASAVARLTVSAPSTARAGSSVPVESRIEVTNDAPRIITASTGSRILIVRGGRVVGASTGGSAPAVPLPLRAGTTRPAQALPESVHLAGCTVDAKGAELPPGEYALVGVLAYGGDPMNNAQDGGAGSRSFVLVSAPVPITVR
jgi:hypothetical protein